MERSAKVQVLYEKEKVHGSDVEIAAYPKKSGLKQIPIRGSAKILQRAELLHRYFIFIY